MRENNLPNRGDLAGLRPTEATITTTAIATTDDVYVVLDEFDPRRPFGPCAGWHPRPLAGGNLQYPSRGDRALVVRSDQDRRWIVAWWPKELDPDA